MKITDISVQARNADRVNVSVDGVYRFSLDILQVTYLGIKIGAEYSEQELEELEVESQFGKLYARTLEYVLMRPHSAQEVRSYLYRKTRSTRTKAGQERPGYTKPVTERVYSRLEARGYIDDAKFAKFWVENRNQRKGSSVRKIIAELRAKGVSAAAIDAAVATVARDDRQEIRKVLEKKRRRYTDEMKLKQYLLRQGFSYDDVNWALSENDE